MGYRDNRLHDLYTLQKLRTAQAFDLRFGFAWQVRVLEPAKSGVG